MKKFLQSPWGAATVTSAFFLVIMGGVAVMAKSMIDSRFKEASKGHDDDHGTEHAKGRKTEPNAQTNTESRLQPPWGKDPTSAMMNGLICYALW